MKPQTALVVIADVLEAGSAGQPSVFLVESLEKVPDTDAEHAPVAFNSQARQIANQ